MKFVAQNFHTIENVACAAVTALVGYLLSGSEAVMFLSDSSKQGLVSLIMVGAAIYASLLGFLISAVAFLYSTSDYEMFKQLRESRAYGLHWKIFQSAIVVCAIATLASLLSLVWYFLGGALGGLCTVAVGCLTFVSVRIARVIWVLHNMIRIEVAEGRRMMEKKRGG